MLLDVFHGFPMLSFQLSLQTGKQKKVARSQVGTVRGLGDHRGVAPGQVVGNDEGRVAGGIVTVELDRGTSFAQTLRICRFSVTIPCTANVDMFRVSAMYWMLNRRSERKTAHTRFTFSSVLAVQNGVRRRPPPGPP